MPNIPFYQPITFLNSSGALVESDAGAGLYFGTASPQGSVVARPGSLYMQGAADATSGTLWIKTSGVGSSTWITLTSIVPTPTFEAVEQAAGVNFTLTYGNVVLSDTVPGATQTLSGMLVPADKIKLDRLTNVDQNYDISDMRVDINNLQALSGVADGSTDLGAFTNPYITDNGTIKAALEELGGAIVDIPTRINYIVANIAARDALVGMITGNLAWVIDATADPDVSSGGALYIYDNPTWLLVAQAESITTTSNHSIGSHGTETLDIVSSNGTDATVPAATQSLAGLLTAADKITLDNLVGYEETFGTAPVGTEFTISHNLGNINHTVTIVRSDGKTVYPHVDIGANDDTIGFSIETAVNYTYIATKTGL